MTRTMLKRARQTGWTLLLAGLAAGAFAMGGGSPPDPETPVPTVAPTPVAEPTATPDAGESFADSPPPLPELGAETPPVEFTPVPKPAETPLPTPTPPASPDAPSPKTFHIGTRGIKDANAMFESRATLETIVGVTNKVTGKIVHDPAANSGSAIIEVDAASLKTGIELRDEHLRGEQWLDAAKHPVIRFRSDKVEAIAGEASKYLASGELSIHGVSRAIEVVVEAKVYPAGEETKEAGFGAGDAAHFKAAFEIKLSDFGIVVPQNVALKVSNTVAIQFDIFASTDAGPLKMAQEEKMAAAATGGVAP
jgi:polyisoprenoid-binding protein YceI